MVENIENILVSIEDMAIPVCHQCGVQLYDIELKPYANNTILRIFIDKETGVNVDDCALVSRYLSELLDVNDVIPDKYILEVSSPGIDRKLKKAEDFRRFLGSTVKIKLHMPHNGSKKIHGILCELQENPVKIIIEEKNKNIELEFENIAECRIVPDFKNK